MPTDSFWQSNAPMLVLAGAAIAWYVGVRALCDTFWKSEPPSPGRIGAVFCLPVAFFGLFGVIGEQPQFALGAIFASSVAAMTLVAGLLVCTSQAPSVEESRDWTRLLPTTAILLLAGFSGRLGILHAALLLVQGLLVLGVAPVRSGISIDVSAESSATGSSAKRFLLFTMQPLLSVVIVAAASWAAWKALGDIHGRFSSVPPHALAGLLVAPALILPMLGTGMALARENGPTHAISSLTAAVQINCCLLFPILICSSVATNAFVAGAAGATFGESVAAMTDPGNGMILPIGVWRIDIVFLMACALILLPAGWGRWSLGRLEGGILAGLYVIYLFLITFIR